MLNMSISDQILTEVYSVFLHAAYLKIVKSISFAEDTTLWFNTCYYLITTIKDIAVRLAW